MTTLYDTFITQLRTVQGLPTVRVLGKAAQKDPTKPYCEPRMFGGEPVESELGEDGTSQVDGTWQVNLFRPADSGDDYALAGRIVAAFQNAQLSLSGNPINIKQAYIAGTIEEPNWTMTTIYITWWVIV